MKRDWTLCIVMVALVVLLGVVQLSQTPAPFIGIADQVARVRGAVVHVGKTGVCQGSGCIISSDGIIITAKHVSDGTYGEYAITLDDGRKFPVKYVVEDTENDIAFMWLDLMGAEPNLPYVELAQEDTLCVGDLVYLMGSPLGRGNFNSVSLGLLAAENRNLHDRPGWERNRKHSWHVMMQHSAITEGGSSGGPVFNMCGEVVGIHVAAHNGLKFAVPVVRFRGTIDSVCALFRQARFNVVPVEEPEQDQGDLWYNSRMGK
ncbi:MAG: trypsin-like serine protease [Candidatus Aegiribacteria sp.]|nr:trypsin-like serine protease [Candidatus Aegiribacteria sp.]